MVNKRTPVLYRVLKEAKDESIIDLFCFGPTLFVHYHANLFLFYFIFIFLHFGSRESLPNNCRATTEIFQFSTDISLYLASMERIASPYFSFERTSHFKGFRQMLQHTTSPLTLSKRLCRMQWTKGKR